MTKEIKTSIIIKAKPEKVWEVFTDFNQYPKWNPFITSLTGEVKEGNKIKIQCDGTSLKPRILAYTKNKELVWFGRLFIKGLFNGEHRFVLKYNGKGTTLFEQSEEFNGILVKSFSKKIDHQIKEGFELMNEKLKEQVEAKYPYKTKKPYRKYYKKPQNKNKAKTKDKGK